MSEKLNCWPGCNAIVVRSKAGNEGKVVRCVRLLKHGDIVQARSGQKVRISGPWLGAGWWEVEGAYGQNRTTDGTALEIPTFPDAFLRPLRDSDDQDEMLRIAGMPNKETTPSAH